MNRLARGLTVSAAVLALIGLAACSPGKSSPATTAGTGTSASAASSTSGAAPSGVSTDLGTAPVTLKIAYCDQHPVEDLIEGFTKLHTNVTVNKQYEDCNNYSTDLKNMMTGSEAPDVAEYVDSTIQTLVPGGYVMDLAPYVKAYGWDTKFPASQLAQLQLSSDGKVHGEGAQYGIPGGASYLGVFYNKTLMTKAGITAVPTTIDEFEQDLEKAKAAGVQPLSLGALDDGAIHLWGEMTNNLMGVTKAQDWVNGKPGSTINAEGPTLAAQKLANWAKRGYFPSSANGTKEDDARAAFADGKSLFTVDGSWSIPVVTKGLGNNVGFFNMPGASASDPATGNGFSAAFALSSKTKNATAAAAFLDYLASADAAKISVSLGMLPVNIDTAPAPEAGVATDLREGYAKALKDNGIITFYDHASSSMHDTLTQGLQGVIAGKTSPADFVKSLQDDWDKNHS